MTTYAQDLDSVAPTGGSPKKLWSPALFSTADGSYSWVNAGAGPATYPSAFQFYIGSHISGGGGPAKYWATSATLTTSFYADLGSASNAYDEQGLTVGVGAEVASYVTAANFDALNSQQAPPGTGGPQYITEDDYVTMSFPAGSLVNPVLKIVLDANIFRPILTYVAGGGGGSFTASGFYGGGAKLTLEVSTTPGTWVTVATISSLTHTTPHGAGQIDTVATAKTIINYTVSGTINTGLFQARLHAYTENCTVWDEGWGGPGTWLANDAGSSEVQANIYAVYLYG